MWGSRVKKEVKALLKKKITHLHEEEECFRFIHVSDEERTQSENTTAVLIQVRLTWLRINQETFRVTYLNVSGQRWNHNAQNKDRYRRDRTHLPRILCYCK